MSPSPKRPNTSFDDDPVTERSLQKPRMPGPDDGTQTEHEADDSRSGLSEGSASESQGESSESAGEERDYYGENEYPADEEEYVSPELKSESTDFRRRGGTFIGKPPPVADEDDDNPEKTNAGPPVKLEIIAGPDAGEVKRFKGVRMVVGRVTGCDLVLTDQSVSRRHLELIQSGKGLLLRDLDSGNGTKVNGERVTERVLQHNDEIELGSTKLRLVDEMILVQEAHEEAERKAKEEAEAAERADAEAAARAAEEPEPELDENGEPTGATDSREPTAAMARPRAPFLSGLKLAAVIAVGIILIGVIAFLSVTRKDSRIVVDPHETQAKKKMGYARTALDDGRYEDAVNLLDQAERLSPGIDTEGLLTQARTELKTIQCLETAQSLLAQSRYDDTRAQLASCPDASEKRNQERARIQDLLDAQQFQALEQGFHRALAESDFAAAEAAVAQMPPARQTTFKDQLQERQTAVAQEKAATIAREHAQAEQREKQERAQTMERAFASVGRKLNEGAFDRATLECDRVLDQYGKDPDVRERATKVRRLIPRFAQQYGEGHRRLQQDSAQVAYKPLEAAWTLYQDLGLPGGLEAEVAADLNTAAFAVAKAAWSREDYVSAAAMYRGILSRTPEDSAAREGQARVEEKASDIFNTAQGVRQHDPKSAREDYRAVTQMTQPGSALHEKAKQQLKVLQPD